MTIVPLCASCRHLDIQSRFSRCAAFPDQIPRDILLSDADHHLPYPGDGGIRYERIRSEPVSEPMQRVANRLNLNLNPE